MEKSSLKIVSNVMVKSKYEIEPNRYLPYDLLPDIYHDVRLDDKLSDYQRVQKLKSLFAAEFVISDDE